MKTQTVFSAFVLILLARSPAASETNDLLTHATEHFGKGESNTLSESDALLFTQLAKGEAADFSDPVEEMNDPATNVHWGSDRTIQADRLAWLCTETEAATHLKQRGITIKGARIEGEVDLKFASVEFPLYLEKCAIPDGVILEAAKLRELSLRGCYTGPIRARRIRIEGGLFMEEDFEATGGVELVGATIGGWLECTGGRFLNHGSVALDAAGITINGSVLMDQRFKADGRVELHGAVIDGFIECSGATFGNVESAQRYALRLGEARVNGSVVMDGAKTFGEFDIENARIGGRFSCRMCEFTTPNANADRQRESVALRGRGMVVDGSVLLDRSTLKGATLLSYARMGQLSCYGTQMIALDDDQLALDANLLVVTNSVFLREAIDEDGNKTHFCAKGTVRMPGATIGGYLECDNGHFLKPDGIALNLEGSRVGGSVTMLGTFQAEGQVITTRSRAGGARLSWETFGDGCWLVLGWFIDYGFKPARAAWFLLGLFAFGAMVFHRAFQHRLMTPVNGAPPPRERGDPRRPASYAKFNALVYALDLALPVIDFYQAKYWLPDASHGGRILGLPFVKQSLRFRGFATITRVRWLRLTCVRRLLQLRTGSILRLYLWLHITAGWTLATLIVGALSGLIRA